MCEHVTQNLACHDDDLEEIVNNYNIVFYLFNLFCSSNFVIYKLILFLNHLL